ncbi:Protein N-acetyltransferase, RimJ/RimL family [Amycolatopsis marina]|uniref:Protein N-acetyltransferase, RimJ/RimL family n=1 Tax=Amycolatopsis marina TaxID=490629 RepID=A0A1I1B6E1_9PSEU|nr:GNAT family protein [Amycolatopsis marina]SFB45216.1 Protein N-acetyltransferase, RimJ/RimL family [Amycolatopsis marina]
MLNQEALATQPQLHGDTVVLRGLDDSYLDEMWVALHDPETIRYTGTHATFTREQVERYLAARPAATDRADWAITRAEDGAFLGEVVLFELDALNESMSFRIALAGPHAFGRGYGTEATRLVLGFAFATVGLHRVGLEVFDFNTRAQRVYEKCGFVREGVLRDALLWDGTRHDTVVMSVLATDRRSW